MRFDLVEKSTLREITIAEFTQLPDLSYGLWDWASGNETCPFDANAGVEDCHDFKTHMGAVNSNHFLPQAATNFAHYHNLAIERAEACQEMQDAAPADGRFDDFITECENEALSLEAIGHHFLQDAWSSGHMWQRWGSPDPSDFESLQHALLVAMTAGLIHGAEAILPFEDAMCAPYNDVEFIDNHGRRGAAVGDLHLSALLSGYDVQRGKFLSCAVSSVREVMNAMGRDPGIPSVGFATVDPQGADCFGQRATNRAMAHGMGLDIRLRSAPSLHSFIPIEMLGMSTVVPRFVPGPPLDQETQADYAYSLVVLSARARIKSKLRPFDTEVAEANTDLEGYPGELLFVGMNGKYNKLPPYSDPQLPWPAQNVGTETGPGWRARTIALLFNRAHATEWCQNLDESDLQRISQHAASSASQGRDAACEVCREIIDRHLRVGEVDDTYQDDQQPLCHLLVPDATIVYSETSQDLDRAQAVKEYCGCDCEPRAERFEGMRVTVRPRSGMSFDPSEMVLTGVEEVDLSRYAGAPQPPYIGSLQTLAWAANGSEVHAFQWGARETNSGTHGFPSTVNGNFINRYGHGNLIVVWKDLTGTWQWGWSITGGAYLNTGSSVLTRNYEFLYFPTTESDRFSLQTWGNNGVIGAQPVEVEVTLPGTAGCIRLPDSQVVALP